MESRNREFCSRTLLLLLIKGTFQLLSICAWVSLFLQGYKLRSCLLSRYADKLGVLLPSRASIRAWLKAGTLRASPVELDRCHDHHDQCHDEGDRVEIEWHWRHVGWLFDVDGLNW